jgi:hypothetical protein
MVLDQGDSVMSSGMAMAVAASVIALALPVATASRSDHNKDEIVKAAASRC